MATSEGGFVGVISLRSADQVEAMSNAIRRLVHHSVAIFPAVLEEASVIAPAAPASAGGHYPLFAAGASRAASASRVAQMAAELGADARTIADLAATFPPLCIEPATSQRALQVVTSLLETVRELQDPLAQLPTTRTAAVCQAVAQRVQRVLQLTADLTDCMEEDQMARINRDTKLALQYLRDIRELQPGTTIGLDDFLHRAEVQLRRVANAARRRAEVVPDGGAATGSLLTTDAQRLDTVIPPLIAAARATASADPNSAPSSDALFAALRDVASCISRLTTNVQSTHQKAEATYEHEAVDRLLDQLKQAIEQGASQEAVDRMRDIIEQLKNDDRMKAAAANLLGATRAAMADPSRQVDLSRSIAEVRHEMAASEAPQSNSNAMRLQLLNAARQMATNVSSLTQMLATTTANPH